MKVVRDQKYLTFCRMLGSNIRFCRIKLEQPQKSLAYAIGVTHQNVQKYESGAIVPSAYRLKEIADYYSVKTDDLLDPSFIHRSTKANEVLDKAPLTPQDAGYLKPQEGIGSLEEIMEAVKCP